MTRWARAVRAARELRRPFGGAVAVVAALLAPSPATACLCNPYQALYVALPIDGGVDAPTNAAVVWLAIEVDDALDWVAPAEAVTDPPFDVGFSLDVDRLFGASGAIIGRFDRELPPHTRVTINAPGGVRPWVTFTTGTTRDDAPPTVEDVHVKTRASNTTDCNPLNEYAVSHMFTLEGLADDRTPAESLVVHLEPVRVGRDVWTTGSTAWASYDLCGGDPTLSRDRHRSYDLEVLDAAANVGGTQRVATCGCAGSGGAGGLPALAALAAAASRRRARAAGTRSTTRAGPADRRAGFGSPRTRRRARAHPVDRGGQPVSGRTCGLHHRRQRPRRHT